MTADTIIHKTYSRFLVPFRPSGTTLLSPILDVFMAGGISILTFLFFNFVLPQPQPQPHAMPLTLWMIGIYYAAFLVNFPHFASSYQLLYADGRAGFFGFRTDRRLALKFWWAGFVVPLVLIGYFLTSLSASSTQLMGYAVSAMYFFVGWHYVKQIFGCVIVLSSAAKVYYGTLPRYAILSSLYLLWAVSFIGSNIGVFSNFYYGIPYASANIPEIYFTIALTMLGIALVTMLGALVYTYAHTKKIPPLSAMVAFVSVFLWLFPFAHWTPRFSNQYFLYVIPLFHSLQYLLFVTAYRRNESLSAITDEGISARLPSVSTTKISRLTLGSALLYLVLPAMLIGGIYWRGYILPVEDLSRNWFDAPPVPPLRWILLGLGVLVTLFVVLLFRKWAGKSMNGKFYAFFADAYVLGFLGFTFLPNALDILAYHGLLPGILSYDTHIFGTSLFLYFFMIAINIHHYFIDNVIWRSDNKQIRKFLFTR